MTTFRSPVIPAKRGWVKTPPGTKWRRRPVSSFSRKRESRGGEGWGSHSAAGSGPQRRQYVLRCGLGVGGFGDGGDEGDAHGAVGLDLGEVVLLDAADGEDRYRCGIGDGLERGGSLGVAEGELGGGGVDGSEQDEVGARLGAARTSAGEWVETPIFRSGPRRARATSTGMEVAARCTPAASAAKATSTRSLMKSSAPYPSQRRFTSRASSSSAAPPRSFSRSCTGPDAALQGLLQHPHEVAAPGGLAVGDEIQVEIDGSQGSATWRSLATSGQWRRPSMGLEAVA